MKKSNLNPLSIRGKHTYRDAEMYCNYTKIWNQYRYDYPYNTVVFNTYLLYEIKNKISPLHKR